MLDTVRSSILSYVDQGLSYAQIATITGRTRNVVAGAVWRARHVKVETKPPKVKKSKVETKPPKVKPPKVKPEARKKGWFRPCFDKQEIDLPKAEAAPILVPIWELQGFHCRWSFGDVKDPEEHRFCGLPKERGAYCAQHARLAYAGLPTRK